MGALEQRELVSARKRGPMTSPHCQGSEGVQNREQKLLVECAIHKLFGCGVRAGGLL